jgi:hypothetical protein
MSKRPRKDKAKAPEGPPAKRARRDTQEQGETEAKLPAVARTLLSSPKYVRYQAQILAFLEALGEAGYDVATRAPPPPSPPSPPEEEGPEDPDEWVRLKYYIDNPWGISSKDEEDVPRNAVAFLDMVCPEISVTVAKHTRVELKWTEVTSWANKPALASYASGHWLKGLPQYGGGRWADAVRDDSFGEAAYDYYYAHHNSDDPDLGDKVLAIWETGKVPGK